MGRRHLALLIALAALVMPTVGGLTPSASAEGFELGKTFGPDGSSISGFSAAGSVAVDQLEDVVYVLDRSGNALYKFDLDGNPVAFGGSSPSIEGNKLAGLSIGGLRGERQVAVDSNSHTIYLGGNNVEGVATALQAFQANGDPSLFTAGPGAGTNEITGFGNLKGVAVDANGNIYTADDGRLSLGQKDDIRVFSSTGAVIISTFGGNVPQAPANMAVDANGVLYVLENGRELVALVPSEYPVTSTTTYSADGERVDVDQARGVAVDPATKRLFVVEEFDDGGSSASRVAIFDVNGLPEGTFGGPGETGELGLPEGIAIGGGGEKVFVPDSPEGGLSQVKIFEEEICEGCAPAIKATTASAVTGDSVALRARINPNGSDTTYWFEYGLEDCESSSCTQSPVDGVAIGDSRKDVIVTQNIANLEPETKYFYRTVAKNEFGTEEIESKTFTTQGPGLGFLLSDGRAWEMVSPRKKFGGLVVHTGVAAVQASVFGDKLAYSSLGSLFEAPISNRSPEPATALAKRGPDGKWTSDDLTPPHSTSSEFLGANSEYRIFTPDLLEAEMEPTDDLPLSPQASERTPYLWSDGSPPVFNPLVHPSNVPPGTKFGNEPEKINPVKIEGASPDLTHIVLRSDRAPLVEGAELESIYMWSDGELEPVSELPQSDGGAVVKAMLGSGTGSVRHAVSDDGARAYWAPTHGYNAVAITLPALYLRDRTVGESVRLDVPQLDASGDGDERPAFNAASADGSVVFFTDTQQLTKGASPNGRDLYRCEVGSVGSGVGCVELTDISAPIEGSGESAEVLGQVSGVSEDGSRLYFVARGVLDQEPNEGNDIAIAGEPNLYYWQEGQGVRFIAALADNDFNVWGGRPSIGFAVDISAAASPNGRFFAFTSEASLTGYENRNSSNELNTEVFVYDSEAESGQLTCVSCNPSGAAAVGEKIPEEVNLFPPDRAGLWKGRWVAAVLPQASQTQNEGRSLYRPRFVLDNGRVFFNAIDPLVPADSNGNWDVYQHEPVGVGTCTASSTTAAVSRQGSGCVGLLSSGTSAGAAGFLDATPSGDDVFFLTRGRLSVLDVDGEIDVYDARVNGITAVLEQVADCAGEACQQSVGPPTVPTRASEAFRGPEPPVKCRKGQRKVVRKGRITCVRKKHRKHGKQQKQKASKNRRGAR